MQRSTCGWVKVASQVLGTAVLCVLLSSPVGAQSTWYVNDDGPGMGDDGSSPGAPFFSIMDALEAFDVADPVNRRIRPGDMILVAPGTYGSFDVQPLPDGDEQEGAARGVTIRATTSFGSPDPVTGTEARIEDPTPDPPIDGPGIIIAEGGEEANPPHPYRTVLDGFIITGWESATAPGGGLMIVPAPGGSGSSPTIQDCSFIDNSLTTDGSIRAGGAISVLERCRPIIDGCTFEGNQAFEVGTVELYGGAIGAGATAISTGTPLSIQPGSMPHVTVVDCTFTGNLTGCRGGPSPSPEPPSS